MKIKNMNVRLGMIAGSNIPYLICNKINLTSDWTKIELIVILDTLAGLQHFMEVIKYRFSERKMHISKKRMALLEKMCFSCPFHCCMRPNDTSANVE